MAPSGKRVAVMRAAEDAAGVAERLNALGIEAALAPVLDPVALDATLPPGPFSAVIATSARALALASDSLIAHVRGLPLYVVGLAGLRAAQARGLGVAGSAADAARLASAVSAVLPGDAVLYLAGAGRKSDLEDALGAAGVVVKPVVVYEARAVEAWSASEAAALARVDAALHYSRRSAEIATRLAERADLSERWRAIAHVAISRDAAAPLEAAGAQSVFVAATPDEAAMFEALSAALL